MNSWSTIFTGTTSAVALILAYLSFRREQNIRREALRDRRRAQAKLITAWWTRVRKDDGSDLSLSDYTGSAWIAEDGHRIWISNSSDDAVYTCHLLVKVRFTAAGRKLLQEKNYQANPYISYFRSLKIPGLGTFEDVVSIYQGTVPPKSKTSYRLGAEYIETLGTITLVFEDADGVEWSRAAGKLTELPPDAGTQPSRHDDREGRSKAIRLSVPRRLTKNHTTPPSGATEVTNLSAPGAGHYEHSAGRGVKNNGQTRSKERPNPGRTRDQWCSSACRF